jgi:NAD+ kinase
MKISCLYSKLPKAIKLYEELSTKYDFCPTEEADIILCLGGDGFMLHIVHNYYHLNKPIYGINCGSLGFLLNKFNHKEDLYEVLKRGVRFDLKPLKVDFETTNGNKMSAIAFNESYLMRSGPVASHLKITLDGVTRMGKLVSDGLLVSTPMGSTAYNRACGGSVISVQSNLLALTSINPFQPLNWKGAIVDNKHSIKIENIEPFKRKTALFCDFKEFRDVKSMIVHQDMSNKVTLIFNTIDSLENKILKTQFLQD